MLPIIKEVKSILAFARKAFTKGSFRCIVQYVNGLISLADKTVKKISEASSEIRHQSELNYAITEAKCEQEMLTKRYLEKARYLFKNTPVYLIIDDTLVERNGDTVQEAQYHHDHNSGKQIKGHQFFTALLWTPLLQLPIFPELYSKNTDSKIEMAQSLIDRLSSLKIKIHTILFDSWYSDHELIKKCLKMKTRVVCSIMTNRKIKLHKKRRWQSLSFISERIHSQKLNETVVKGNTYQTWSSIVILNNLPSVKMIISEQTNKDDELVGKAHLISTNIDNDAAEIISAYKLRWKIETYHRDIKQNLGFATVFFARREGIVRHSILATMAYAVLSLFMSRNLTKTPAFKLELFLEHPKHECLQQTTFFRVWWHIVLLMYRSGKSMTIGECCAYLKEKSTISLVREIVVIENKPDRLERFEEVFIS
ncbi:transposase [Candidatus Pacearchaeota archaeon]|nr:transposase [Candidatus Pacearchaeota archaeon]